MHAVTLVSPMEIARAMTPCHSLDQVRPDRLTAIHFRVKLDPVLFKVETLLTAIRAVNRAQRDWQAQIGDPGRARLATGLTLHTLMSSHKRCFGSSKLILGLAVLDPRPEPILLVVHKAPAAFGVASGMRGERNIVKPVLNRFEAGVTQPVRFHMSHNFPS
jgi:hypothetical protein